MIGARSAGETILSPMRRFAVSAAAGEAAMTAAMTNESANELLFTNVPQIPAPGVPINAGLKYHRLKDKLLIF